MEPPHGAMTGRGRLDAARQLNLKQVPVISLTGLSPAQKRAFMLWSWRNP